MVAATAPTSRVDTANNNGTALSKPPMALKIGERTQMSRALRVKEENKQLSLALKKATAEATLSSHKVNEFTVNNKQHNNNSSSNTSQNLTNFTTDGGISTGTHTTDASGGADQ